SSMLDVRRRPPVTIPLPGDKQYDGKEGLKFSNLLQSKLPMPTETDRAKVTVEELASRIRSEMVPLGGVFSYFLALPIADEDLKQYLEDPIAALPPAICAALPKVAILLVPYLERANGKGGDV